MPHVRRCVLLLPVLLWSPPPLAAQTVLLEDRPAPCRPLRAWTPEELDQREALYLYARGLLCEREDRLLEAIHHYEASLKLDNDAVPVMKALGMLLGALDRGDEAMALARKVLERDADDFQVSYVHARQLRSRGQLVEACAVLQRGLKSPRLADRPDLHQQMEYDLGTLHERMQQYENAAAAFARSAAILDQPDGPLEGRISPEELQLRSAETHERVGRNCLEAGKFSDAVAAFQRAQAKYPPGASRIHYHLAQIWLKQGRLTEALASLDQHLQSMPQGTDAHEWKIVVLQKLKRESEILPWLEQASQKDRFNVSLKLLLARQYVAAKQTTKAEQVYRELADVTPTEGVYRDLFQLWCSHVPQGAEACVKMFNTTIAAAAANGGSTQAKTMLGALRENVDLAREMVAAGARLAPHQPLHFETLQFLAVLGDRQRQFAEAEILYRACLQQPLTAKAEPVIYGGMLRLLWKAQRTEAVVEVCRLGLKNAKAANHVLLRAELARALATLGRWDDAIAEADAAVHDAKDSEKLAARHVRVRILTQADRIDQAEAECQALLKECTLPGDILEVRYLLSNVYSVSRRFPQAEAELQACLKIDPNNAAVSNDLGYLWADQDKLLPEAEALIRKAIDVDRKTRENLLTMRPDADKENADNACYIDSLGWVLFRRGQLDQARKELEHAASLPGGTDPVIWDHLGDVLQAQGESARATAAWQKALDFYDHGKQRKIDLRYRLLQEKLQKLATDH